MSPIELRDSTEADVPTFYKFHTYPEANKIGGFILKTNKAFHKHWETNVFGKKDVLKKAILSDGVLAGYIVCFYAKTQWEIGYWTNHETWGKGIATAAVKTFLKTYRRRPLYAHVAQRNAGSIRVLEKCGFVRDAEDKFTNEEGASIPEFIYKLS